MCEYQCTSVSFIKLSNRTESNRIIFPESECSTGQNATEKTQVKQRIISFVTHTRGVGQLLITKFKRYGGCFLR